MAIARQPVTLSMGESQLTKCLVIEIYQPQTMDNAKHDIGEVFKLSPLDYIKFKVFIVANNNTMHLRHLAQLYCLTVQKFR